MRMTKKCKNCGCVVEFRDCEQSKFSPIPKQRKCPECGKSRLAKYTPLTRGNPNWYIFNSTTAEGG